MTRLTGTHDLDFIEGWKLEPLLGEVLQPVEVGGLKVLQSQGRGLQRLYLDVPKIERWVAANLDDICDPVRSGLWIPPETYTDVWCAFQWYATMASSFLDLVAILAQEDRRDYARRVAPGMLMYRHKVAAHLSYVQPRRRRSPSNEADNQTDHEYGMVHWPQVNGQGRWEVGGDELSLRNAAGEMEPRAHRYRWSLTLLHEEMAPMFGWPVS